MKISNIGFWFGLVIFLLAQSIGYAQEATITGKVVFKGTPPPPKPINFGAERQCALAHGDKTPNYEELVINSNGAVKGALLYIKEDISGNYSTPAEPVTIDQKGCIFIPHVSAVMVGQPVKFLNDDALLHNVRTVSKINPAFNVAQPIQGMSTDKKFPEPEIGIQLKCDVHYWMSSYLHIFKQPFFAVTGDDGSFTIKGIPAGTYTLELWHESLGTQSQSITIGAGEQKTIEFTLEKA